MRRFRYNPFAKYIKGETALHVQCVNYLNAQYPHLLYHHSPNEGKRSPFQQYLLKITGVSSGFPDLMIHHENYVQAIELKFGDNVPTDKQAKWLNYFLGQTYSVAWCCWNFDTFKLIMDGKWLQADTAVIDGSYRVLVTDDLPTKIRKKIALGKLKEL